MALKEIFPNEDATRFDLVEELYSLPQKPPMTMHTFSAWWEDWVPSLLQQMRSRLMWNLDEPWLFLLMLDNPFKHRTPCS